MIFIYLFFKSEIITSIYILALIQVMLRCNFLQYLNKNPIIFSAIPRYLSNQYNIFLLLLTIIVYNISLAISNY